jgi:hypothetical protein
MDIPLYTQNPGATSSVEQNYNQQLNATLSDNLGILGFAITPIKSADLTTTPILNPNTGKFTTVMDLATVGSVWFLTDLQIWVGKQIEANPPSVPVTVLQQFTVAAWP